MNGAPLKLLLIEDSPSDVMLLKSGLDGRHVELGHVERLADGFDAVQGAPPDVVLLDLGLPDSQGIETLRRFVAQAPEVPVVVMTGTDDEELGMRLLHEGAQDYLVKGRVAPELLHRSVRYAMQRKSAEHALREANAALETRVAERTAELRKARNVAERADRLKSQFLANMSHELRTPLNAIIGFTGTLLMKLPGELTEKQEEHLQLVMSSAEHLLSLVNDLLDVAKIEEAKAVKPRGPVSCKDVLSEVATVLRPMAAARELELVVETPEGDVKLDTDVRSLWQILVNLGSNAVKFTNAGSVRLVLRRGPLNEAIFSVHDTGCGIRPEDEHKLFDAYSQMDSTDRIGAGLGLHLSQKLAHLLGGRIQFTTEYGKGSHFWLSLPME